ncbi:MAG: hypothetical protein CMK71_10360 [Pseudomonadaceae bacterium]|mgnify:FL=1|nr:hypothetical protein [Pseudomonadaceae bacterium]
MLRSSFQARIASVLVLLLLVVIGSLYLAVQKATGVAVRAQASEQLEIGSRVFQQLLEVREQQLSDAVNVLTADFGFKQAVASEDAATIRSALANHGARIHAEVVMLLDLDGAIQVSTQPELNEAMSRRLSTNSAVQMHEALRTYLMPLAGQIYLLVETVVKAPVPIANVLMGFRVDENFTRDLQALTHLELSLIGSQDGLPDIWVSTLPDAMHEFSPADSLASAASREDRVMLDGQHFLRQQLVLARGDGYAVQALLYKSLTHAQQAFAPLDNHILLIASAALLASLVGALLLARNISRPVRQLVEVSERIGRGDYQVPLQVQRSDELGRLAKSFQQMQFGIAERERQLAHNALHDGLTGLPNRTLAAERLGSALTAERPVSLLYLSIVEFRTLNETQGPANADKVLQQLGQRLSAVLRPGDSLARIVADEFLLLLENANSESAVAFADRIQPQLKNLLVLGGNEVSLALRIGIASYPGDGNTPDELIRRARLACTDAGQSPGWVQVYERGRDTAHQRQMQLIRDLRHAAEQGELCLHFQPKIHIANRSIIQAEALLRWQHPQFGMVSPGEFIPLAERSGSIQLLTNWVIGEAMRQLAEWQQDGLKVDLSLNISTEDLLDPHLPARINKLLAQHALDPAQLTFEITESGVMLNPQVALQVLYGLRDCGVSLSVDDFGTGYSSLAQLKRMPVQELKIDQSFIRELNDMSEDAVIVRSTIEMSHSLGLKVVAEGVEHERSFNLLKRWGCDVIQGYLISKPLTAQAFVAWLEQAPIQSAETVL